MDEGAPYEKKCFEFRFKFRMKEKFQATTKSHPRMTITTNIDELNAMVAEETFIHPDAYGVHLFTEEETFKIGAVLHA